jgi:hypothetical protein
MQEKLYEQQRLCYLELIIRESNFFLNISTLYASLSKTDIREACFVWCHTIAVRIAAQTYTEVKPTDRVRSEVLNSILRCSITYYYEVNSGCVRLTGRIVPHYSPSPCT